MKYFKLIIIYLLISLLLCACSNKEELDIDNDNYSKEQENEKINEFIELFKKSYPNITIMREDEFSLEDGTYVYVFLYANRIDYENISTTNICFVTETSINAVDLAGGDLDFKFAENEDSFKVLENPNRIAVELSNISEGTLYDYQVTFSLEETASAIKIESKLVE